MIIGILQARTKSSRLPQKVLRKIKGKTLLELYVNRVKESRLIDNIVIATTTEPEDNVIENIANKLKVDCFRGSENDLLDRYYQCAKKYKADIIVRLCSDDPFVDYQVVDRAIQIFKDNQAEFVTNHFEPTYPEGLDIEVYSIKTLERLWNEAKLLSEREHVFPYIQNYPDKFKIINFTQKQNFSHLRWTIDYECDFQLTKIIYDNLYDEKPAFLQEDILNLLEKHPEISQMNSNIKRKEGIKRSKANDRIIK
jgi:spore coat polysaccharide biosynthesis protein SpsF (cytidylyltransferase family)